MLHGPPCVYTCAHCHQMITQQRPKGPQGVGCRPLEMHRTLPLRCSMQPALRLH